MTLVTKLFRKVLRRVICWASIPDRAPYAVTGSDVLIVEPFTINHPNRLFLGSNIYIGAHAAFNSYGGIRIGDGCAFGPFVHIYSVNHRYADANQIPFDEYNICKPVDIGPYVWIGGDVSILPGVSIGEGAVIGAGSVVLKDVPAGSVAAGYPAKPLKLRDMERFQQLKTQAKILRHADGPRLQWRSIGNIPRRWFVDAGLPCPLEETSPGAE